MDRNDRSQRISGQRRYSVGLGTAAGAVAAVLIAWGGGATASADNTGETFPGGGPDSAASIASRNFPGGGHTAGVFPGDGRTAGVFPGGGNDGVFPGGGNTGGDFPGGGNTGETFPGGGPTDVASAASTLFPGTDAEGGLVEFSQDAAQLSALITDVNSFLSFLPPADISAVDGIIASLGPEFFGF
jgi:hypothetical protein